MRTLNYRLVGTSTLLMHNGRLANPLDPLTRHINSLQKKGRGLKSEDDLIEISRYEFLGGLYTAGEPKAIGFPGHVVFAVIRGGARKFRRGKEIESGLQVRAFYPLTYDGPQDPDELWRLEENPSENPFVSLVPVGIGQKKVLRCRPKFDEWSLDVSVDVSDKIEPVEFEQWLEESGFYQGIGDGRSMGYGRFAIEKIG